MSQLNQGFEVIHDLVKMRWVPEIIGLLSEEDSTYTDLLSSIEFLSHTELQRKLKKLQAYNCVEKIAQGDDVLYHLNEFGYDLNHIFEHFKDLSNKYKLN